MNSPTNNFSKTRIFHLILRVCFCAWHLYIFDISRCTHIFVAICIYLLMDGRENEPRFPDSMRDHVQHENTSLCDHNSVRFASPQLHWAWYLHCTRAHLYHRIIEWSGLKRTTVIISFQPPSYVQGYQPPDQAAQSHIRPGLEWMCIHFYLRYACFGFVNKACCSGGCWVTELLSSEQWCTAEASWCYRGLQCASRLTLQPGCLRPTRQCFVVLLLCKNKLTSPWSRATCLSKAWVKLKQFLNYCSWHRVPHRMWKGKRFFGWELWSLHTHCVIEQDSGSDFWENHPLSVLHPWSECRAAVGVLCPRVALELWEGLLSFLLQLCLLQ